MHNLEAKIAEYRRLGMNPSEYETMYIQVRHMYDEARTVSYTHLTLPTKRIV